MRWGEIISQSKPGQNKQNNTSEVGDSLKPGWYRDLALQPNMAPRPRFFSYRRRFLSFTRLQLRCLSDDDLIFIDTERGGTQKFFSKVSFSIEGKSWGDQAIFSLYLSSFFFCLGLKLKRTRLVGKTPCSDRTSRKTRVCWMVAINVYW